jgi:hypothetical protein
MKFLIDSFYRSIIDGTPVPIPYREIVLTARIMDGIFSQLEQQRARCDSAKHIDMPATNRCEKVHAGGNSVGAVFANSQIS